VKLPAAAVLPPSCINTLQWDYWTTLPIWGSFWGPCPNAFCYDPHMGVSYGSWHSHNIRERYVQCEVIWCGVLDCSQFRAICSLLTATIQTLLRYDKYISVMTIDNNKTNSRNVVYIKYTSRWAAFSTVVYWYNCYVPTILKKCLRCFKLRLNRKLYVKRHADKLNFGDLFFFSNFCFGLCEPSSASFFRFR
jgi:hypothetical protein